MLTIIREERLGPHFNKFHLDLGDGHFLFIHELTEPDVVEPHDHPFSFKSTVVKGSYVEEIYHPDGRMHRVIRRKGDAFDVAFNHIHRIIDLPEGECKTAVLYGPYVQEPGFWQFREDGPYRRQHDRAEYLKQDPRDLHRPELPKRPGGKSYRSAATGQFVGKDFADENPDTTVSERRR